MAADPLHVIETALGIGRATAISLEIADNPSPVGLADNVAAAKEPFDAAIIAAREAFCLLDAQRQKLVDIEYGGRRLSSKDGWRDDEGHEWCLWLGQMVECPRCAFMFGADHHDDHAESYTCPNCLQDEMERAIRDRLGEVIVSHGVGEMSELLAELLALVTGGCLRWPHLSRVPPLAMCGAVVSVVAGSCSRRASSAARRSVKSSFAPGRSVTPAVWRGPRSSRRRGWCSAWSGSVDSAASDIGPGNRLDSSESALPAGSDRGQTSSTATNRGCA